MSKNNINDIDISKKIEELNKLPSSFPTYNEYKFNGYSPNEIMELEKGNNSLIAGNFKDADIYYKKAIDLQLDGATKAILYDAIGQNYLNIKKLSEAQENFEKAIDLASKGKNFFTLEKATTNLTTIYLQKDNLDDFQNKQGKNLLEAIKNKDSQKELESRLALGEIYKNKGDKEKSVTHYSQSYKLLQGPINYAAHKINQSEVGFSDNEKIGTDNIQQCVVVIIRDPLTKETALAHVDRFTKPESISNDVIDKFPKDHSLEVYLVGGRDKKEKLNNDPNSPLVSDENIKKNKK